jgi:cytochrome c-type biogenesis protein CcmH/NrfF
MWLALIALTIFVIAVLFGGALAFGAPLLFALPVVLVVLGGAIVTLFGGREALRKQRHHRRMRRFREQARAQKSDFSAADRETLI